MSINKALSNVKIVELSNGEKVEVKKLPLGQYAKLMIALKNLPSNVVGELQSMDTANEDTMIQTIFGIFGESWGQLLEIIAIGSGVDKDRLENDPDIGLDGGIELFAAIYEVNNLNGVVTTAKNLFTGATK